MKKVEVSLSNSQSHQQTMFSLEPGLNFILADDNNVGKSTIFKLLSFMTRVPNVQNSESLEILRVGEVQGYASFKFDEEHIILWLFRDEGDRIRVFFESRDGFGGATRSVSCPKKLLEALDIIACENDAPLNFNDADSVQLVVQDTNKNDEVLARVLIDLKVEGIRVNLRQLSKQVVQDYRFYNSKLEDTKHTLSSLHYNDSVDSFKDEEEQLNYAGQVVDALTSTLPSLPLLEAGVLGITDNSLMSNALLVLNALTELAQVSSVPELPFTSEELESRQKELSILRSLAGIDTSGLGKAKVIADSIFDNMQEAIATLDQLMRCAKMLEKFHQLLKQIVYLHEQQEKIEAELTQLCQVVQCPMKGKVYYSDEKCIPYST